MSDEPRAAIFYIVITLLDGSEHRLDFDQDEVSVGRREDNDLVLPDANVSGLHCRIVRTDGKYILVDLNSTNGTYINGVRIEDPTVVTSRDRVSVGGYALEIDEPADVLASYDEVG